jgi:formyl-CoA transferase
VAGEVAKQVGNNHPIAAPTGLYPTADGQILLAATGDKHWQLLCKVTSAAAMAADTRYKTGRGRVEHREALNEDIAAITRTQPSGYWFDLFSDAGIPCGPVYTIDKVFADKQVMELPAVMTEPTERFGQLKLVAQPNNIDGHAKRIRLPPAALGEHTDAVLGALGFTPEVLADLRKRGII